MKRKLLKNLKLAGLGVAAAVGFAAENANAEILYTQTFDGLTLMDSVNERLGFPSVTRVATDPNSVPIPNAFSKSDPSVGLSGSTWTIDNTLGQYDGVPSAGYSPSATTGNVGVPGIGLADYGVDEWEGWSFASKDFWTTADQQDRQLFTNGVGTIAVVDPDEYFDMPNSGGTPATSGDTDNPTNGGYYNSGLKSPSIAVAGDTFYTLKYDSSWRDESFDDTYGPNAALNDSNNQSVEVLAVFDDGTTRVIDGWNSNSLSPEFLNDAPNSNREVSFLAPTGATSVSLHFNIANAANDWWWAVDNLDLAEAGGGPQVWSENFEDVVLGDSVNERRSTVASKLTAVEAAPNSTPRPNSFTNVAPTGWNVDNTGLPAGTVGQDDKGVFEWEGWNFAPLEFWTFADTQGREQFTKCVGNCAIADSDEWTDLGGPGGPMDTLLESPSIDISSVEPGKLRMSFDSSWRAEDDQLAILEISYDGGNWEEVLRWESHDMIDDGMGGMIPNPDFHGDNTNESVYLALANPAIAASAKFRFSYLGGNNNWWWAVDSIQVSAVPEPSTCIMAFIAIIGLAAGSRRRD